MQPRILTLPDALRDALERDFKRDLLNVPDRSKSKKIDACGQIVAYHMLGIAAKDPDLVTGESADHKTDPETKQFLKEFYQAYLGMECGTSSPVLQIQNLPPEHGDLFKIGLMRSLTTAKNGIDLSVVDALKDAKPQRAHNHISALEVARQHKMLQSLYCRSPGEITQPTVFVDVDEAIDLLAQNEGGDFSKARQRWVERLRAIRIKDVCNQPIPLITPNPASQYGDAMSTHGPAPEHILYTDSGLVDDIDKLVETDPETHKQQLEDYNKFNMALNTLVCTNAATATGSRTANTMLLWNDALVLHARGPLLGEGEQRDRLIEPVVATHIPHPTDPIGLAHAIGGPCSQVNLDQLMKLGTSDPVKQRARTS